MSIAHYRDPKGRVWVVDTLTRIGKWCDTDTGRMLECPIITLELIAGPLEIVEERSPEYQRGYDKGRVEGVKTGAAYALRMGGRFIKSYSDLLELPPRSVVIDNVGTPALAHSLELDGFNRRGPWKLIHRPGPAEEDA